jgi:hypothetical protein
MMKRSIIFFTILLFFDLSFGQSNNLLFKKEISSFKPGDTLKLEVKGIANIIVQGLENSSDNIEISGPENSGAIYELEGRITIRSQNKTKEEQKRRRVYYKINLPMNFNFEFNCEGGHVSIKDLTGKINGRMLIGDIKLERVSGIADIKTNEGNVLVLDCDLNGMVHTLGGNVDLIRVLGDLDTRTEGGHLEYQDVFKKKYDGLVKLHSKGGEIEIDEAPYGAHINSEGGNIIIKSADVSISANTKGGNIILQNTKGDVWANTGFGNIDVKIQSINGEKRKCELISNSGNIHLTVPRSFNPTVFVRLAYTKDSSRNFKIQSDFDLNITESKDWDLTEGPPRKFIIGESKKEGNDNYLIDIKTVNGDVTIKSK